MRVGLATTSYPRFGGDVAGVFVEGFALALATAGHTVEVFCPEPAEAVAPRARRPGVEVHEVPYARPRRLARTFYGDGVPDNVRANPLLAMGVPAYAVALDRAIGRALPRLDALVSHWAIPSGIVAARLAAGRPHLAVLHSADVHLLARLPGRRAIGRRLLEGTTAAWFVSSQLHAKFVRCVGAPPPSVRVHVGPMGFAPSEAREVDRDAARRELGLDGFTALALSRLVPIKGVDDAIRAVARSTDTGLLVAGDGAARADLEALAGALQAPVRFVGHVGGARKDAMLSAADAFVLPSVEEAGGRVEGVPTALLEAMSAGLPVVATATGGIPDVVRDGVEGLLVPPRRPDAIAAALDALRRDRAMRRALGDAARARASRHAWPAQRDTITALLGVR